MGNLIESIISIFFSVLPVLIILGVVMNNLKKQVPNPTQNQKQLPQNSQTDFNNNESELEKILREIRGQMNTMPKTDTKTDTFLQENQSYELTNYENNNKELQNYESTSRELQSYETTNYEEVSYENLYKEEKSKTKKKNKIVPAPESISTKKHIQRREKNTLFTNKDDIKKAFIIAELLKTKF